MSLVLCFYRDPKCWWELQHFPSLPVADCRCVVERLWVWHRILGGSWVGKGKRKILLVDPWDWSTCFMVTSDCKAWIKWPVLSSPVHSTALILMVNKLLSSLHGASFWEHEKGVYGISTSTLDLHTEAWLCWDLPCRFSDKDCSVWRSELSLVFCNHVSCHAAVSTDK